VQADIAGDGPVALTFRAKGKNGLTKLSFVGVLLAGEQ